MLNRSFFYLALLSLISGLAHAEGERTWTLNLSGEVMSTDNLYFQATNDQSALVSLIKPNASYLRRSERLLWQVQGGAELGFHTSGEADNFTDAHINSRLQWTGNNQDLAATIGIKFGHDAFGTERTEGSGNVTQDLDLWRRPVIGLQHRWGIHHSTLISTELDIQASELRYTTNRANTLLLDRDELSTEFTTLFNLSPKTAFLLSAGYKEVEFPEDPNAGAVRNGQTLYIHGGARWQATAKTFGDVRVGRKRRESDSNTVQDESTSWRLNVGWSPSKTSSLVLSSRREFIPSFRVNTPYIEVRGGDFYWTRSWTQRFDSKFYANYLERAFEPNEDPDQSLVLGVRLTYHADDGFDLYIDGNHKDFSDDVQDRDYTRADVLIGFNARFN